MGASVSSAWGVSWEKSWGVSWGPLEDDEETPDLPGIPAHLIRRRKPRRKVIPALRIGETDTMALSVLSACC